MTLSKYKRFKFCNAVIYFVLAKRRDILELAAEFDNNPAKLIYNAINMTEENRLVAGKLLTGIYTNSTFQNNLGAYIRVSKKSVFS